MATATDRVEDMKATLLAAVQMRPPKFTPLGEGELPPRGHQKVSALEDYMLELAHMHAELEAVLFWVNALVAELTAKVDQITGYELALPAGKRQERISQADINRAKRTVDPVTFELGAEMKQLRESVLRQIARFEFEQNVVSRAYTMISGG